MDGFRPGQRPPALVLTREWLHHDREGKVHRARGLVGGREAQRGGHGKLELLGESLEPRLVDKRLDELRVGDNEAERLLELCPVPR